MIHEANAYPGMTVRMLAKYADAVLIAAKEARGYLPATAKVIVTGNPLRDEFLNLQDYETARKELGLDERPVVLSFGGSLGARRINEVMTEVLIKATGKAVSSTYSDQAARGTGCRLAALSAIITSKDKCRTGHINDMALHAAADCDFPAAGR